MPSEFVHRDITCNGIRLHVAEQGEGPLVLLCHGWPELWFSWRHQLPALAAAGFRAVVPDMRGFGRSDAPADVHAYTIMHLVGDMVGLVQALGESEAVIVGHDWGAPVAWHSALFRPDLFRAVAALSVPYRPRGAAPPLAMVRAAGLDRFYWIYFQEPGVAEAEFECDVAETMRRILATPGLATTPRTPDEVLVLPEVGGFLDIMKPVENMPDWLSEDDLAVMVGEYRRTGFRGGLNYYRNIERNWELTAPWQGAPVRVPALFIAGTRDPVISFFGGRALKELSENAPGLKRTLLVEGAGHWIQQERPVEVNAALIEFLCGIVSGGSSQGEVRKNGS